MEMSGVKEMPTLVLYVVCHDDASEAEARAVVARVDEREDDGEDGREDGNDGCFEHLDLTRVVAVREREREESAAVRTPTPTPTPTSTSTTTSAVVRAHVLRLPAQTPFLETGAYELLMQAEPDWADATYVGIVTYSVDIKCARHGGRVAFGRVARRAAAAGADAVGLFSVVFHKYGRRVSVVEGSVFQHGLHFYRAWTALARGLGYTDAQALAPDMAGFYCNWWFARPELMRAFGAVCSRGVALARGELAELFDHDSHYRGDMSAAQRRAAFGREGPYPLHPFVFERLPALFLHHVRARVALLLPHRPLAV